jgi:hypothetical protein
MEIINKLTGMEVVNIPDKGGGRCCRCNDKKYYWETPCGADYFTCPHCEAFIEFDDDYDDDNECEWKYCETCKFASSLGKCSHGENGCTDNVYFSEKIVKFKHEGKEYFGTPKFNTKEIFIEYKKKIYDIVEECYCDNKQYNCPKASYPSYGIKPCRKV